MEATCSPDQSVACLSMPDSALCKWVPVRGYTQSRRLTCERSNGSVAFSALFASLYKHFHGDNFCFSTQQPKQMGFLNRLPSEKRRCRAVKQTKNVPTSRTGYPRTAHLQMSRRAIAHAGELVQKNVETTCTRYLQMVHQHNCKFRLISPPKQAESCRTLTFKYT